MAERSANKRTEGDNDKYIAGLCSIGVFRFPLALALAPENIKAQTLHKDQISSRNVIQQLFVRLPRHGEQNRLRLHGAWANTQPSRDPLIYRLSLAVNTSFASKSKTNKNVDDGATLEMPLKRRRPSDNEETNTETDKEEEKYQILLILQWD
jgi:hypothetical protein